MANETTINPDTKVNRMQTIRAMETISANLGGRDAFVAFLNALPADVSMTSAGLSNASVAAVAQDDAAYTKAVKAFAAHMGTVLAALAAEG